jgi:hypothetical protein
VRSILSGLWVFIILPPFLDIGLAAEDQTAYLELLTELEHQGFIQKSSMNGVFAVVKEQKVLTHARSNYLDPLAHISDYVRHFVPNSSEHPASSLPSSTTNAN